jgi:putative PEP-CTERM system histidine kinase
MIPVLYTLNIALLLPALLAIRSGKGEKRYSLALVQTLFALPLLALEYFYLGYNMEAESARLVFFSEIIFGLVWLSMTLHLHRAAIESRYNTGFQFFWEISVAVVSVAVTSFFLFFGSSVLVSVSQISFHSYGFVFFSALLMLVVMLYSSWRLEQFWGLLGVAKRWEYKIMIVGCLLICGTFAWSSSYRITYLTIYPNHLFLLSILLFLSWLLLIYAVVHHRLLNRKIFISRKVVYSSFIPSLLACYFIGFGIVSLIMRTFGLELSFVLKWLIVVSGLVAAVLIGFSGKIRRNIHFFISTHFYNNKYEYRDEWIALSSELQGAETEKDIVSALRNVLEKCLYTTEIYIWLGDSETSRDYILASSPQKPRTGNVEETIASEDPLIQYLKSNPYFHTEEKEPSPDWQKLNAARNTFFTSSSISLIAPISSGSQLCGFLGLGPEYTGGHYGHDDFDLLGALGSQTASSLLAARMAEKLAHAREQQAWNRLSAFVLHDIKNAATMLSLLQANAPQHIHEPEFQQDMLELVDDSLKRMKRVEQRLKTLKDEIEPDLQKTRLSKFLTTCCRRLETKLPSLKVRIDCAAGIAIRTDPNLLGSIIENLLLNASQACSGQTTVDLTVEESSPEKHVTVKIADNGPGIPEDLLPSRLFEPFTTSKKEGSGIGLWQVEKMITSLGATIKAHNMPDGGACFTLTFPSV